MKNLTQTSHKAAALENEKCTTSLLSLLRLGRGTTGGRPLVPFLLKRADNAAFFFRGDDDTDIVRKTFDFRSFSSSSGMRFAAKNKENDDENPVNTPRILPLPKKTQPTKKRYRLLYSAHR